MTKQRKERSEEKEREVMKMRKKRTKKRKCSTTWVLFHRFFIVLYIQKNDEVANVLRDVDLHP